jgi:hypothetical protein
MATLAVTIEIMGRDMERLNASRASIEAGPSEEICLGS